MKLNTGFLRRDGEHYAGEANILGVQVKITAAIEETEDGRKQFALTFPSRRPDKESGDGQTSLPTPGVDR